MRDFGPLLMMVALAVSGCSNDSDDSGGAASDGGGDGGSVPGDAGALDGDAKDDAAPGDASVPDAPPATVEEMTSVTYKGVTFTFDRPVPVGHFVTGEPFALSTESFAITEIDPPSGDLSADGHIGHGAMQDPYVKSEQGFDSYIASSVEGSMRYGNTAYVPEFNVDPAVSGPIEIASEQETTIVKSVRLAGVTDPEKWQTIDKYVPLTMLALAPPEDAYPPASSGETKKLYRRAQIDWSVLRNLTMPSSFSLDVETAQSNVPSDLGLYGASGERLRRFRVDAALGATENNYSGHIAPAYAKLMILLHSGISEAERQEIADQVIRFGIQIEGLVGRGWGQLVGIGGGAGQQGAIHPWIYYSAFLLQDADLLSAAQWMRTSMNGPCFWAGATDIGAPAPSRNGVNAQTFFEEMRGVPFSVPDEYGSNLDTRYGVIAGGISAWETLAIMMLDHGTGSVNGAEALLVGGAFDESNLAAAHVAFIDRYRTWTPWVMAAYDPRSAWRDLYDLVKPLTGIPSWTGVPDQMPIGGDDAYNGGDGDQFTGGDGQISWDYSGYDYATEPVLRRDMRYSLDGIQWVEQTDVDLTGSVTGLLVGEEHYCGYRQVSEAGAGAWSLNYPRSEPITSGTFRNVVTTTGSTAPVAPANTVVPRIHQKLHPAWGAHVGNWVPASAALAVDAVELAAGVGYWSGYPAPAFTYQWMRDGVAISGATSQQYVRTAADAEADITCSITATNASGSESVATPAVTAPALTVLPPSKLVDTTFRGAFAIDYEIELTNASATNCDALHRPSDVQKDGGSGQLSNMGSFGIGKSGSYPAIVLPCQNSAVAGTTYTLTYEAVLGSVNDKGAKLDVRDANGNSVLDDGEIDVGTNEDGHKIVSGTATLTVPAGASGDGLLLSVRLSVVTATGLKSGGDARLTLLTIEKL